MQSNPDIPPRNHSSRIAILLVSVILLGAECRGQGAGTLFFLDYQFGVPTDFERTAGEILYCSTCDGTGTSQSHTARTGLRISLSDLRLAGLPIWIAPSLHISTGSFRSNPYTSMLPVDTGIVTIEEEFTLGSITAGLGLEGGITFPLGPLQGSAGLWGDIRIAGYLVQQQEILSPSGTTFSDSDTKRRIAHEGDQLSDEPFGYGLHAGIGLPVDICPDLRLSPTLATRLDLPALSDGIGLRSFSALLRLGLELHTPPGPPLLINLVPPPPR